MGRVRLAAALAFLVGATAVAPLAAPTRCLACSCAVVGSIADYARDPDSVVVAGVVATVGPDQRGLLRVDRWYHGLGASALAPIQGGDGADCGVPLAAGQRLVFVATWADGAVRPSICAPYGDLASPEGRRLLQEAEAVFGPGIEPGPGGPTGLPGGPTGVPDDTGPDQVLLLATGGLVLLAGLSLLAFARPDRPASASRRRS